MKQLQNNFTSPEQSKRLLELGLPAGSADCYWHFIRRNEHALLRTELNWLEPPYVDKYTAFVDMAVGHDKYRENRLKTYLPCWSVGRLIEIMLNSQIDTETYALGIMLDKDVFSIESLIDIIDEDIKEFDFSKLEE